MTSSGHGASWQAPASRDSAGMPRVVGAGAVSAPEQSAGWEGDGRTRGGGEDYGRTRGGLDAPGDRQGRDPSASPDLIAALISRPSSSSIDAPNFASPFTLGVPVPVSMPQPVPAYPPQPDRGRAELRPVAAEQWSLRVTMDAQMKEDLETLRNLLSHTAGGDLTAVLREALRCAVEKHGKRRGALPPTHPRTGGAGAQQVANPRAAAAATASAAASATAFAAAAATAPAAAPVEVVAGDAANGTRGAAGKCATGAPSGGARDSRAIPAAVRREVWARDEGCCSWKAKDGRRCGSRWKLEIDHIVPVALGGTATADNLRLLCRAHNVRQAEKAFSRHHMSRFGARRDTTRRESAPSGPARASSPGTVARDDERRVDDGREVDDAAPDASAADP
jgi:hypothetical protein